MLDDMGKRLDYGAYSTIYASKRHPDRVYIAGNVAHDFVKWHTYEHFGLCYARVTSGDKQILQVKRMLDYDHSQEPVKKRLRNVSQFLFWTCGLQIYNTTKILWSLAACPMLPQYLRKWARWALDTFDGEHLFFDNGVPNWLVDPDTRRVIPADILMTDETQTDRYLVSTGA